MTNLFATLRQQRLIRAVRQPGDPVQAYGTLLDAETKHDLDIAIASVFIGFLFTVVTGFPSASPIFTAFLKDELGLSNSAYGLILTIPYLTVLIQIPYSFYARCHNNIKPVFIIFAGLSKLVYLVPAFIPLLAAKPDPGLSTMIIAGMMLVGSTCNWIADSSINTWFGAMIPTQIKGIYFSTRQTLFTVAALFYSLCLSIALRFLGSFPYKYTLLFGLGVLFGCIDILIYLGARPPAHCVYPYVAGERARGSMDIAQFLRPFRDPRYRIYLLFATSWSFAVSLAAPYFNVYLLQEMHASLGIQTLLQQILPYIATILFMRRVGRLNDSFGYKPMLLLASYGLSLTPLLWLFTTPANFGIVGIANFLAGVFGTSVDLAILSLAIFLAPHQERATYVASKNVSASLLGFVPATLLGGWLSDRLQPVLQRADLHLFPGHTVVPFHVLIVLSCTLRLLATALFLPRLREDEGTRGITVTVQELVSLGAYATRRRIAIIRETMATLLRRLDRLVRPVR